MGCALVLVNHAFTHSLTHSRTHSLTHSLPASTVEVARRRIACLLASSATFVRSFVRLLLCYVVRCRRSLSLLVVVVRCRRSLFAVVRRRSCAVVHCWVFVLVVVVPCCPLFVAVGLVVVSRCGLHCTPSLSFTVRCRYYSSFIARCCRPSSR